MFLDCFQAEQFCCVVVVDLLQDGWRQADAVDLPAALGRDWGGRVVEILVFGFEEAVVDVVELVAKDLLRSLDSVGDGVGAEDDAVLILFEELAGGPRLTTELAYSGCDVNVQVGVFVESGAYVAEVFSKVADVKSYEFCFGVASEDSVAGCE